MKLITCAGYYGTGSSAVTDLLNECDNVHDMGDYEFRFVQDPDGISDLEYNLVENNHRHNSGYAIKRYEKNVDFLNGNKFFKKYNRYFDNKWKEFSREYINSLVTLKYKGAWHQELRDLGFFAFFIERSINKIVGLFKKEFFISVFLRSNNEYVSYPAENFYSLTKKYIDNLFEYANKDNKEFVMADQLVPPSNVSRYLRYFNNLKVICVERDPRDLFILEKKWRGTIIPKDVKDFCIWYRTTREHRKYEIDDKKNCLRINFEDLIYKYDEYTKKIFDFVGIKESHHTKKNTRLIPEQSKKNTKLWVNNKQYRDEILIIEQMLPEYLYKY